MYLFHEIIKDYILLSFNEILSFTTRDSQKCQKAIPLISYQRSLQVNKVFHRPSVFLVKMSCQNVWKKCLIKISCKNVSSKSFILYFMYFQPSSINVYFLYFLYSFPSSIIHPCILSVKRSKRSNTAKTVKNSHKR